MTQSTLLLCVAFELLAQLNFIASGQLYIKHMDACYSRNVTK